MLLAIVSIGSVCAEDLDDESMDHDELMVNDDIGSFYELEMEIRYATAGDTITLNHAKYIGGGSSVGITIDKTLTINGKDGRSIIDAERAYPIFWMKSGILTINNLTLQNAISRGAIFEYDDKVIVGEGNIFINNTARDGGAISGKGDLVVGEDNIFINNTAVDGGAIYADKVVVGEGNIFINNTAGGAGGAIYARNVVVGGDNIFINNTAGGDGGAISAGNYLYYYKSILENNNARRGSAGYSGTINSDDCYWGTNNLISANY